MSRYLSFTGLAMIGALTTCTWVWYAKPRAREGKITPNALAFKRMAVSRAGYAGFTCVQVGPDRKLYASADDGRIFRFPIRPDGTVDEAEIITSLQSIEHGPRLVTGFCFDPRSSDQNPTIWVTNGKFTFNDAPDFSSKITRMSGANLEIVEDAVIGLPRSVRDHLTNQPVFGPDGALYFQQGSNTASGAPDEQWGNRPEHLLNASILRLDVRRITLGRPIDVRTIDAGGNYDPSAADAPLTIFATGVRVAYDLLWASNGKLYAPVNGSSAGGNAPDGPGVPALQSIASTENDWLFMVEPGRYYGHPNPAQKHFVLNGGNPTVQKDAGEVLEYPIGVRPDSLWSPAIFDFGKHVSPNGIIEYTGNAFGGKLNQTFMVCRYNRGGDVIVLKPSSDGKTISAVTGIGGLSGFKNPLDLAEDGRTGRIYVADYGARQLFLLQPVDHTAH